MNTLTKLAALAAITLTTGCSTMVNERMQSVSFTAPTPTAFSVTGLSGRTINANTPVVLTLDSAVGAFRCERYVVDSARGVRTVDTGIQGWFWFGSVVSLTSMIIDLSTGSMCELPGEVRL